MTVVGYEQVDVDDMVDSLDHVLKGLIHEPFLYNSVWKAKDMIEGMQSEGMFE